MRIEMTTRGVDLTDAARGHVERHLYFTLGRFSSRVEKVHVRFTDESGWRKSDVAKTCRIVVRLLGLTAVIVEQASADLSMAFDVAVGRAGRTVARKVEWALSSRSAGDGDEKKDENP